MVRTDLEKERVARRKYLDNRKAVIKAHVPTDEIRDQVRALAYLKTTPEVMAEVIGISQTVLLTHYRLELKNGAAVVAAKLGMLVIKNAIKGDKGALGQIARAQGIGRQDVPPGKPDGAARKAEEPEKPLDLNSFSDADLAGLLAALATGEAPGTGPGGEGRDRATS